MLVDAAFECQCCGAVNATSVDVSAGRKQSYTEDCQNCCRPHLLYITVEMRDGEALATIDAEPESDFF